MLLIFRKPIVLAKTYLLVLCLFAVSPISLAGNEDWKIEYDDFDPMLHGKVIRFNKPMAYQLLTEDNIVDSSTEHIKIGRQLQTLEDAEWWAKDREHPRSYESIEGNLVFTVQSSFWVRKDWFSRIWTDDWHVLLLIDSYGVASSASISILVDSDSPELYRLYR